MNTPTRQRETSALFFNGNTRSLNDLAERARTKKLIPDEISGGTFTITNPGVFGGSFGLPIINQLYTFPIHRPLFCLSTRK